jgi:hypothetical protein
MADCNDGDDEAAILDLVNNLVITDTDAVGITALQHLPLKWGYWASFCRISC